MLLYIRGRLLKALQSAEEEISGVQAEGGQQKLLQLYRSMAVSGGVI